jgi:surface antigen
MLMTPMLKFALPIALSLVVHPAQAQWLGPAWETNVTLTRADLDMIKAGLAERIHNQRLGSSISWRNPESGNSGSIALLKIFARQGRRCEQIEYRMSPPEKAGPSDRFVLTSCLQPDGSWKLA